MTIEIKDVVICKSVSEEGHPARIGNRFLQSDLAVWLAVSFWASEPGELVARWCGPDSRPVTMTALALPKTAPGVGRASLFLSLALLSQAMPIVGEWLVLVGTNPDDMTGLIFNVLPGVYGESFANASGTLSGYRLNVKL